MRAGRACRKHIRTTNSVLAAAVPMALCASPPAGGGQRHGHRNAAVAVLRGVFVAVFGRHPQGKRVHHFAGDKLRCEDAAVNVVGETNSQPVLLKLPLDHAKSLAASSTKSSTMMSGWYTESSVGSWYRLT